MTTTTHHIIISFDLLKIFSVVVLKSTTILRTKCDEVGVDDTTLFFDGNLHVSKSGWLSVFFSVESKISSSPSPLHSHQSLNVFKSWLKFCSLYNNYCNDVCQLQIWYTKIWYKRKHKSKFEPDVVFFHSMKFILLSVVTLKMFRACE